MTEFEKIRNLIELLDKKAAPKRPVSTITKTNKSQIKAELCKNIAKLRVALNTENTQEVSRAVLELNELTLVILADLGIEYHKEFNNLYKTKLNVLTENTDNE